MKKIMTIVAAVALLFSFTSCASMYSNIAKGNANAVADEITGAAAAAVANEIIGTLEGVKGDGTEAGGEAIPVAEAPLKLDENGMVIPTDTINNDIVGQDDTAAMPPDETFVIEGFPVSPEGTMNGIDIKGMVPEHLDTVDPNLSAAQWTDSAGVYTPKEGDGEVEGKNFIVGTTSEEAWDMLSEYDKFVETQTPVEPKSTETDLPEAESVPSPLFKTESEKTTSVEVPVPKEIAKVEPPVEEIVPSLPAITETDTREVQKTDDTDIFAEKDTNKEWTAVGADNAKSAEEPVPEKPAASELQVEQPVIEEVDEGPGFWARTGEFFASGWRNIKGFFLGLFGGSDK